MSENKEKIRYILKFYYKKGKNATQDVKKIYEIYEHDAVSVRHKAGSSVFNLEIFMSMMHLALVNQSLEKSIKSWKKLSKTGTIAVIILDKELNIDHKTVLNYLEKAVYKQNLIFGCHMI